MSLSLCPGLPLSFFFPAPAVVPHTSLSHSLTHSLYLFPFLHLLLFLYNYQWAKIMSRTLSLLNIAIIGITSTCFFVNLGVLVDYKNNGYALESGLEAVLLLITIGYCWSTRTPKTDSPVLELLVRSYTLAFVHILFAVWFAISVRGSDGELLSIVGGFNWPIALWIMIVSWIKYQFLRRKQLEPASNNNSTNDLPIPAAAPRSSGSSDPSQPQLVHLYQPPLSLSPTLTVDSTREGSNNNNEDDDGLELEELPKYQRRAPAQVATIIDMSNVGTGPSETSIHVQQGEGEDTTVDIELEDSTEAPAYSASPVLSSSSVPSSTAQEPAMDSTSNPFTPETQPGTISTHLSVPAPSSTNEPPAYSP